MDLYEVDLQVLCQLKAWPESHYADQNRTRTVCMRTSLPSKPAVGSHAATHSKKHEWLLEQIERAVGGVLVYGRRHQPNQSDEKEGKKRLTRIVRIGRSHSGQKAVHIR